MPNKKELSQLFLETYYASRSDIQNHSTVYNYMLSILADADHFHLLVVDVRAPMSVYKYILLVQPDLTCLCKTIQYLLTHYILN